MSPFQDPPREDPVEMLTDDVDQSFAHRRFAACEPDLPDSILDEEARKPYDLVIGQDVPVR